jgi:hypothetical protein
LQQVTEANTNQRRRKMNKGQQLPVGHGVGSRFARGLQKAEDYIEPLPEKATADQKKFYDDFVAKFNADSDYRVKIIYENKGAVVALPVDEHAKHGK